MTSVISPLRWCAPAVLAVTLLAYFLYTPAAEAFDCFVPSIEASVEQADAIVFGTVESVSTFPAGQPARLESFEALVAVERYLKGSGPTVVTIGPVNGWMQGFWQVGQRNVGEQYVLFLKGEGDSLILDDICTRSRSMERVDGPETLAQVEAITGPGVPPDQSAPRQEDQTADQPEDQPAPQQEANSADSQRGKGLPLAWTGGMAALLAGAGALGVGYVRRR